MDMCNGFQNEMQYDGALVMPSSYAVMNEEDMTYVEGGWSVKSSTLAKGINIFATVISIAVGIWSGVGLLKEIAKRNAKGLFVCATRRAVKYARIAIADCVISGMANLIGQICNMSLGDGIVWALNHFDKNPSYFIVQF